MAGLLLMAFKSSDSTIGGSQILYGFRVGMWQKLLQAMEEGEKWRLYRWTRQAASAKWIKFLPTVGVL